MTTMDEEELQMLYQWVDEIPLSRPKRNISRDFSDAVLMAEVVKHFFPRLVDMHNYSPTASVAQKRYNWLTLDQKVFRKLNFHISKQDIEEVATGTPGAIERVLRNFQTKLHQIHERKLGGHGVKGGTSSAASAVGDMGGYSAAASGDATGGAGGAVGVTAGRPPPARWAGGIGAEGGVALSAAQLQQQQELTAAILREKDETIGGLHQTIQVLEAKLRKMDEMFALKDARIAALTAALRNEGIPVPV
eukprot:TRINITY_DN1155_c0_g3_i1.p1 TRINITY_DN1155_c0_g3~~TRINITY_DN1155_c0_g3_i1.p1  ORF type:complete len:248 (-),score=57.12 TRINITY_DN1155_c0_g3_i1:179-922(-)